MARLRRGLQDKDTIESPGGSRKGIEVHIPQWPPVEFRAPGSSIISKMMLIFTGSQIPTYGQHTGLSAG